MYMLDELRRLYRPDKEKRKRLMGLITCHDHLSNHLLTLCLFCQENIEEHVHEITQDSEDETLKEAFEDSPVTLEVYIYRISSEKALDSRAGDLKYHNSCWNKHIMRRVPDFPVANKGSPFLDEIAADPTGEGVDDKEENDSHSQMTENNNNISQTSRAFIIVELM